MTIQDNEFTEIPVRVVSTPAPAKTVQHGTYQTISLVTAKTAETLLPPSTSRICAYVRALDDDVVISGRESDAAAGAGAVVSATDTAPTPIYDHGPLYAAAQTITDTQARVTVIATYEKPAPA